MDACARGMKCGKQEKQEEDEEEETKRRFAAGAAVAPRGGTHICT